MEQSKKCFVQIPIEIAEVCFNKKDLLLVKMINGWKMMKDEDGWYYRSQRKLLKDAGMSDFKSLENSLNYFIDCGILEMKRGKNNISMFKFNLSKGAMVDQSTCNENQSTGAMVDQSTGAMVDQSTGAMVDQSTIINKKEEIKNNKKRNMVKEKEPSADFNDDLNLGTAYDCTPRKIKATESDDKTKEEKKKTVEEPKVNSMPHSNFFGIETGMNFNSFFPKLKSQMTAYISMPNVIGHYIGQFKGNTPCGDEGLIKLQKGLKYIISTNYCKFADADVCRKVWTQIVNYVEGCNYQPMTLNQAEAYCEVLEYIVNAGYAIAFCCKREFNDETEIKRRRESAYMATYCAVNGAFEIMNSWKRLQLYDINLDKTKDCNYICPKTIEYDMFKDLSENSISEDIKSQALNRLERSKTA